MKTEHTLRYLLLRHFKLLESAVPRERYLEVSQSLRVETRGRSAYAVTYLDGGLEHEQSFPFDAFAFYERGDTRADDRSIADSLENRNDELARDFAQQVFGIAIDSLPEHPREPLEAHHRVAMAEMTAFALAISWAAGLDAFASLALLALGLAEFATRGRLISAGLLAIVALAGPPSAALLAAVAYGLLHFLDPDPGYRNARVGLCLLAGGIAAARLGFGVEVFHGGLPLVGAFVLATALSAARSFYSSHFRALSLAFPFYCAGLTADGHLSAAALGLLILALGTAFNAAGHRWSPVQRGRL